MFNLTFLNPRHMVGQKKLLICFILFKGKPRVTSIELSRWVNRNEKIVHYWSSTWRLLELKNYI